MFGNSQNKKIECNSDQAKASQSIEGIELQNSLRSNITLFKNIFSKDETLIIREFENKQFKSAKCCIIYIEGMVDTEIINKSVIQPILLCDLEVAFEIDNLLEELKTKVITNNDVTTETEIYNIVNSIINGNTLLLLDGYKQALLINAKGWQSRAITEPESTKVLRGPREGFTESILVNLSLVRRKIKNPNLKFQYKEIGEITHTKTCICYIEGLAKDNILSELTKRLDQIKIDGVLDSGYIQELIKDAPYSPLETVGSNERPDVIAAKLLEGRIALFVDGSPVVLTVPYLFVENIQSNEDYYMNYVFASFNRLVRGFTAVMSIAIPAIYLAFTSYHQEMIPTRLLLSISAARQNVPIPTVASLFLMLILFDILREASTRMPSHIGDAISIIGTIVLGQAAVEAKLVSAPVIIVTAITGIMSLLNMNLIGATIACRAILLLCASIFGIYGFLLCYIVLFLHLMSIRSFGVPYMLSMTKAMNHDGQDAWIRAPWWTMTLRPKIIASKNLVRQATTSKRNKERS